MKRKKEGRKLLLFPRDLLLSSSYTHTREREREGPRKRKEREVWPIDFSFIFLWEKRKVFTYRIFCGGRKGEKVCVIWGRQEFVPSSPFGKNLLCLTYECRLGGYLLETRHGSLFGRGGLSLPPFPCGALGSLVTERTDPKPFLFSPSFIPSFAAIFLS